MPEENIDILINAGWLIPVVPRNTVLRDCSIAIHEGRIIALLPSGEAQQRFSAQQQYDLPDSLLIPGLINAHGHAAMSLLRGYADDQSLHSWLNDAIWPAESRWMSEEFVYDGAEIAIAEMLLGGTTCFSDMYFFPDQTARAARSNGIKCQLAFPVLEFPSAWARNADEYIHKGLDLRDEFRDDSRISIAFGPHAPYTVNDPALEKIATLAGELDAPIQIHLHETADEVAQSIADKGVRPIEHLHKLGLLSPLTQCVHMTQLIDSDIDLLAASGSHVIHCPESNLKLGSGFCPVEALQKAGINIALGTDGAASNNDLNLLGEARTAALIAKGLAGKPELLPAHEALELATINGARALGIDGETGSIEIGKAADLVAINLANIASQPLYNAYSQLLYTDSASRVSHTWVDGKLVVEDGQLLNTDQGELIKRAQSWQTKIQAER
ncbi:MAG: TRZ/ATZ family hydrolase [Gammaproteobacteria bacterium]|nr:TRZ/ATZ family hydrolase [Gammaproteobacteria bacterium]MBQ0838593.1 TRZ/ATZ family hydrolase [Gammaproteobacteria bacterium]